MAEIICKTSTKNNIQFSNWEVENVCESRSVVLFNKINIPGSTNRRTS